MGSTAPVADACAPNAELSSVRRAQAFLTASPRDALTVLDRFEHQCSSGALTEERLALRALASCAQADLTAGRAALAELRSRFPSSPALQRVERACATP
ncbi:MAG: hypothetical protein QM817_00530 [Archangium sp.]